MVPAVRFVVYRLRFGELAVLVALLQVIDVVIRSPVDDLQNGANAGASSVCTPLGAGAEGYVRSISRQRGQ